jgi:heme exporter protein A
LEILECKNLSYSIGYKQILKKISFSLYQGELVVLTGNNGAGKTTLLKLLSNYSQYTESFHWKLSKPVLSYLGHELGMYSSLTLQENISYFKGIVPNSIDTQELEILLKNFNLYKRFHEPIIEFSKGMKQKAALIRAFLPKADIYLLDEPFSGLDVTSSKALLNLIYEKKQTSCIILVTHDKEQIKPITDRNFVIDMGGLSIA